MNRECIFLFIQKLESKTWRSELLESNKSITLKAEEDNAGGII